MKKRCKKGLGFTKSQNDAHGPLGLLSEPPAIYIQPSTLLHCVEKLYTENKKRRSLLGDGCQGHYLDSLGASDFQALSDFQKFS